MKPSHTYWHRRDSGSYEVLCGSACFRQLKDTGIIDGPLTKWVSGSLPLQLEQFCISCQGCGTLLYKPETCFVHDDRCPSSNWLLSFSAVEFAGKLSEVGEITELDWREAERLGAQHPDWTGDVIAYKVIGRT